MEELNPNFVPDGWLSDIDDFSSPPAAKNIRYFEVLYVQAAEGVAPTNTKKNNTWGECFVLG